MAYLIHYIFFHYYDTIKFRYNDRIQFSSDYLNLLHPHIAIKSIDTSLRLIRDSYVKSNLTYQRYNFARKFFLEQNDFEILINQTSRLKYFNVKKETDYSSTRVYYSRMRSVKKKNAGEHDSGRCINKNPCGAHANTGNGSRDTAWYRR